MNSNNNKKISDWINTTLGFKPRKISLYIEALTHSSYSNEQKLTYDYENLEFLGDSIVSFLSSNFLYQELNFDKVGKLAETKILLVQSKTLAKASKEIGLDKIILLGDSFKKDDDLTKIYEDCFESLIAAIFLDQGITKVNELLERTIFKFYKNNELQEMIDYKSLVQIIMVKHNHSGIIYKNKNVSETLVESQLCANGIIYGTGYAKNKKDAEKQAAKDAYSKFANLRR